MLAILQKLKNIKHQVLLKFDNKTQQPLLSEQEIIELLYKVQSNKTLQHTNDIAFKQIGDFRSIYRGHGMDYEESRRYQAGDDPRYMNWQLSARTGQHYMKVFREERQPGIFILLDRRHSMRFGTQQRLKITQAVRAATIASFSAQEKNYSIAGVILDEEIKWFKESNSKQSFFNFISQAAIPAPPIFDKTTNEPDIKSILSMLNEILITGSTIYIISDFHDLNKDSQATLVQLSTKYQIQAIHIIDPAERKLPMAGNVTLKSAENKGLQLDSNSSQQQQTYQSAADKYFSSKKHLFEDLAISYQAIFTTDDEIENKIK